MSEPNDPHKRTVDWRNWAGDERCRPAAVEIPGSIEEVSEAIARAGASGRRVRVAGAGHSFSDIALTDGSQLRLDRLTRVLDVDRSSGLVRVQAGITIRELSRRLAEHGLAMENLGDIDAQSIAGAISTATHGTGARLCNISAQVVELTLVLADGSTLECSEDRDPELFRAARVGLGALGVIAEVTLRCVPAFTLRGVDAPAPLADTLARFEDAGARTTTTSSSSSSRTPTPRSRAPTIAPSSTRARAGGRREYANDVLLTNHAFELICRAGRRFPRRIPELNRLVTRLAGSATRVDRSDRIFASPRLVRFTEMEYALPREHTPEAVRRVLATIEQRGFRGAVPDRGANRRGRRRTAQHRRWSRQWLCGGAHVPRNGVEVILPRRRGDHGRARRASTLG